MPVNTKTLIITAAGAAVLCVGGYIAAQAVVGNEVEKSLAQTFANINNDPALYVTDINVDKTLFNTAATATVGIIGVENATATVNLLVDHGVINSPVTGTLRPNDQFLVGDIDINLVVSHSSVVGQLTAEKLMMAQMDGTLHNLIVDINSDGESTWGINGQAEGFTLTQYGDRVNVISPYFNVDKRGEEVITTTYLLGTPKVELFTYKAYASIEGIESGVDVVEENQLASQNMYFRVADVGFQSASMGSGSLNIMADNWNVDALQRFLKAYNQLEFAGEHSETTDADFPLETRRALLVESIESAYELMTSNPTMDIKPFEADISLPMLGIAFQPRLAAELRFKGDDLPKGVVYSAMWDRRIEPTEEVQNLDNWMSATEAENVILQRLAADINLSTPPEMVLAMIPMPFRTLFDPMLEEQHVSWQEGRLMVNGQQVM